MSSGLSTHTAQFWVICVIKQISNNIRLMFERLVCANPAQINTRTKCDAQVICGWADIYTCVDHWDFVKDGRWDFVTAVFCLLLTDFFIHVSKI